jgi:hypothetical protein
LWQFEAIVCNSEMGNDDHEERLTYTRSQLVRSKLRSQVQTSSTGTRYLAAFNEFFCCAHLGKIATGPGLGGRNDHPAGEGRLLNHAVREGKSVRKDLGDVLSFMEITPQLDLDAHDPWLETLDVEQRCRFVDHDLQRTIAGNIDILACYIGYHAQTSLENLNHGDDEAGWGIYLSTAGIETLAREAFLADLSPADALTAAARALYGHELFHFLTEVAITLGELQAAAQGNVGIRDWLEHGSVHDGGCCETEEALANAHALLLSEPAHRDLLRSWMRHGPVGYRDFHRYEDDAHATREALREVLTHSRAAAVAGLPALAEMAFDLAHVHTGLGDIPLHLVVSPGSAYEAGEWSWVGSRFARQP